MSPGGQHNRPGGAQPPCRAIDGLDPDRPLPGQAAHAADQVNYKYFPDVEAILAAWHERQLTSHLAQLTAAAARAEGPSQREEAVLETYALIQHDFREAHRTELAAHLHQAAHVGRARQQLRELVRDLVADAAAAGQVRGDVAADELAAFCLNALAAATSLPSKAAVQRLVQVTLTGLGAPGPAAARKGSETSPASGQGAQARD